MHHTTTVFTQLLHLLPRTRFDAVVVAHKANRYTKTFSCWQQLVTLLYAQASEKDSLREIETALRCRQERWYHIGLASISRSNLAYANEHRPYEVFESLFYALLQRCRELLPQETAFAFKNDLYALDASTVNLCLSLFPWAKYRTQKGALKLHTLLNVRTQVPEFLVVTDGKCSDIRAARNMDISRLSDSILVFDRGYIDYAWFYSLHKNHTTFVTRAKSGMQCVVVGQQAVTEQGVIADEWIELVLQKAKAAYPERIRRITYYDVKTNQDYVFLTNSNELSAGTIAAIYKSRWQVELFFKWIKQHLKVKTFLGTSKNAVLTQIWVAMIYYLLLAYLKFQTKCSQSLLMMTRLVAATLFEPLSLIDLPQLTSLSLSRAKAYKSPQLAFF